MGLVSLSREQSILHLISPPHMYSGPQRRDDPTLPKETFNSTRTGDNSNFTITPDQNVEIRSGHRGIVAQVTHLAMFYCLSHAPPLRTMYSAQTSFSLTHGSTVWEDRGRYAQLVPCMTASTSPAAPSPRQNSAFSPQRKTARKPKNELLLEDKTETRKSENLKINSA